MRLQPSIKVVLTVLIFFIGIAAPTAIGQTKQIIVWRDALNQFQDLSLDEQEAGRETLMRIRTGIEFWIRLHPGTTVTLPSASEDITAETTSLKETVAKILAVDSGQAFKLGETIVSVTAEASPLSPVTNSVSYNEISELHITNVTDAVQYLPGLALDKKAGRNQTGVMIRGFDTRQIGVYLDNIPVLVPYDGYADINRFLASDIASVDVAKGYSSPLIGPNGLGGAINLVTRQPEKKFEGDMTLGTGSGDMLEAGIHLGTRWDKFFARVGMDWLQTDYFPLSGDFVPTGPQTTFERIGSDQRDVRYSGRVGWTPSEDNQYVFSWTKQKADYGVPPYSGLDPQNNRAQYWQWAYWNRDSYYLNTNTKLGNESSLRFRAFLDFYPNQLNMYRDATYTALRGVSMYDDHSEGFSAEFNTLIIPRNNLSASFFLKGDTHKSGAPGEPWAKDREYLTSIGLQDVITISSRLRATVGLSLDHLDSTWAQNVQNINGVPTLVPFKCADRESNGFSDCLPHQWTANPLASVSYSIGETGTLFFTFAKKSHFPNMKDRYSSKSGGGIPNPTLEPEHSRNYSLGYTHHFARNTLAQIELFRSDMYDAIESADFRELYPDQCPGSSNPGYCVQTINIGKGLNQGVELSVQTSPIRRFNLNTNYTYLTRKYYDMPRVLPIGTPKHRVVAVGNYQLPRDILITAAARYEAGTISSITINDVTLPVPSSKFATMDLSGSFPIWNGFKFQIGVKNLFDRNYYFQEGFPEAGRSWYLNTRYAF